MQAISEPLFQKNKKQKKNGHFLKLRGQKATIFKYT